MYEISKACISVNIDFCSHFWIFPETA